MADLIPMKPGLPVANLVFAETTIPSHILPDELYLPTYASLSIRADRLHVEVKIRHPDTDWWEANDPVVPSDAFDLEKDDILGFEIGGVWGFGGSMHYPAARLAIRDPLGIDGCLFLRFACTDGNNSGYWLRALAKMLTEQLGVPPTVPRLSEDRRQVLDEDDIPF